MTLGLSLGLDICLLLCFYIFAQSVNHSLVSFCFCVQFFRGGEDNFFNFTEILQCDTFLEVYISCIPTSLN